jgi:hypothetical protein
LPSPVLPHSLKIGARRYKVVVQQHIAPAGLMGAVNYTYAFIRVATHSARTGRTPSGTRSPTASCGRWGTGCTGTRSLWGALRTC